MPACFLPPVRSCVPCAIFAAALSLASWAQPAAASPPAQAPSLATAEPAEPPSGTVSLPADTARPQWTQAGKPCWDAAGARHGVDPWLLYATAYVESRYDPAAVGRNKNGTVDLGLMQINSTWLPTLRKWGVPDGAWRNACASTYIGAWIMAANIRRYGYTWQAIAAYNVGSVDTPKRSSLGLAYARKVYEAYAGLAARRANQAHVRPPQVSDTALARR